MPTRFRHSLVCHRALLANLEARRMSLTSKLQMRQQMRPERCALHPDWLGCVFIHSYTRAHINLLLAWRRSRCARFESRAPLSNRCASLQRARTVVVAHQPLGASRTRRLRSAPLLRSSGAHFCCLSVCLSICQSLLPAGPSLSIEPKLMVLASICERSAGRSASELGRGKKATNSRARVRVIERVCLLQRAANVNVNEFRTRARRLPVANSGRRPRAQSGVILRQARVSDLAHGLCEIHPNGH